MKAFLSKVWESLENIWRMMPKEIKVALFIAVSYGLADVISALEVIEVGNTWLAIILNIGLVFLKELKPRLDRSNNQ